MVIKFVPKVVFVAVVLIILVVILKLEASTILLI